MRDYLNSLFDIKIYKNSKYVNMLLLISIINLPNIFIIIEISHDILKIFLLIEILMVF